MSEHMAGGTPAGDGGGGKTSIGLEADVAALLSYLIWIVGLIVVLTEKENQRAKFHGAQGVLLSIALVVVNVVVSFLPLGLFDGLVSLASVAVVVIVAIQAYQGKIGELPVIGAMATSWAGGK